MNASAAHQTVVMAHQQVTLNLLECIKHNTHEDQQRRAAEELCKLRLYIEQACKSGHTGNHSQEQSSMIPSR